MSGRGTHNEPAQYGGADCAGDGLRSCQLGTRARRGHRTEPTGGEARRACSGRSRRRERVCAGAGRPRNALLRATTAAVEESEAARRSAAAAAAAAAAADGRVEVGRGPGLTGPGRRRRRGARPT